jgi:very-short-patch-repair endonuclease
MGFGRRARPDLEKWAYNYDNPTYAELCLEPYIASLGQVYRFQHRIWHYCLDFYIPVYRLAIEVDGDSHNTVKGKAKDIERDSWLRDRQDIYTLRFSNQQATSEPEAVISHIRTFMGKVEPQHQWYRGHMRGQPKVVVESKITVSDKSRVVPEKVTGRPTARAKKAAGRPK